MHWVKEITRRPGAVPGKEIDNMEQTIIAYKNGSNWEVNNNGYVYQLPYWVKTKKQVREYFEGKKVEFAK